MCRPRLMLPAPGWPAHIVSRIGPPLASEGLAGGAMLKNMATQPQINVFRLLAAVAAQ
jgi:hypothetical protein